jgi:hypothetical protein
MPLPLRKELVDTLRIRTLSSVISLNRVLGVEVRILADVFDVNDRFLSY